MASLVTRCVVSPETDLWEMPVFEVNDQHILVTGGSSGFGRHFARFLASNGARVTLAARRAEALASVVAEINAAGGKAQSVVLDVTLADKIDVRMEQAEATFGPIHAVVNNAGVTATKPALDQDERAWDSVVDTNLKGVWLVAQAAARRMIANKVKGSIVNIASILGLARRRRGRALCDLQGRRHPDDQGAGARMGALWHSRQCAGARIFCDRAQRRFLRERRRARP